MKINFILPFPEKTGGAAVVMEHSHGLSLSGHDVKIYFPQLPYSIYFQHGSLPANILRRTRALVRNLLNDSGGFWFGKNVDVKAVPQITDRFIRDADVIVATAWPTAYSVAELSRSKGIKFYFVQDYEIWNGRVEEVDASYRLPLKLIVTSPWLRELMVQKFQRHVEAEIHYGVDHEFFRPDETKRNAPTTILMMYHVEAFKGSIDGLDVLKRVHEHFPNVRIRVFGLFQFPENYPFIEYYRRPQPDQLLELYQSSHIFLSPSIREGWGIPILEAMACKCAVVATRTGCVPLLEHNENLLSADPGNKDGLFAHLKSLIEDEKKLRRVAERGNESVRSYQWPVFTRELENLLIRSVSSRNDI